MGRNHRVVLGKHSGLTAVLHAFRELGVELDPLQGREILDQVRRHAGETKRPPTIEDLRRFQHLTASSLN